jgi:hypothetical protein
LNLNQVFPAANCTQSVVDIPALKRRKIPAAFSGGDITSDGVMCCCGRSTADRVCSKRPLPPVLTLTGFAAFDPQLQKIIGPAWHWGAVTAGPATVPLVLSPGNNRCRGAHCGCG